MVRPDAVRATGTSAPLVNHVTGEDRWTAPLLAGATIADVGDRFDGDLLGDDPVGAFAAAGAEATDAAAQTDPEPAVHLSFGDVPAAEYLHQLAADHLIHGWDLAAATGGDRQLRRGARGAGVADWFAERESMYRAGGAIGPRVRAASDDPQDRLLAAFGRDSAGARATSANFETALTRGALTGTALDLVRRPRPHGGPRRRRRPRSVTPASPASPRRAHRMSRLRSVPAFVPPSGRRPTAARPATPAAIAVGSEIASVAASGTKTQHTIRAGTRQPRRSTVAPGRQRREQASTAPSGALSTADGHARLDAELLGERADVQR